MEHKILRIVGLKYHDFKERLDELFDSVIGRQISLSPDEDNPGNPNAVIAYFGTRSVGQVRRADLGVTHPALHRCGEEELMARVVEVDREYNHLYAEIDWSEDMKPDVLVDPNNSLCGWTYTGPDLIKSHKEMKRLKHCLSRLSALLKAQPECWTAEMQEYLDAIEAIFAYDISKEKQEACRRIDEMLFFGRSKDAAFEHARRRLDYLDRELASDQGRESMAQLLHDLARSREMDKLLKRLGDEAVATATLLPKEVINEVENDLGMLMTHLLYWELPLVKLQQVRCLIALYLRLEEDGVIKEKRKKLVSDEIINFVSKDRQMASRAKQIVANMLLEETDPELYETLDQIQQTAKKQNEADAAEEEEDWSQHPLYAYLTYPNEANTTLPKLERAISLQMSIKDKLVYMRAMLESGQFARAVPHKVYTDAFGTIGVGVYSKWMGPTLRFSENEIEAALESLKNMIIE